MDKKYKSVSELLTDVSDEVEKFTQGAFVNIFLGLMESLQKAKTGKEALGVKRVFSCKNT